MTPLVERPEVIFVKAGDGLVGDLMYIGDGTMEPLGEGEGCG
jgi:hypothetical protein